MIKGNRDQGTVRTQKRAKEQKHIFRGNKSVPIRQVLNDAWVHFQESTTIRKVELGGKKTTLIN